MKTTALIAFTLIAAAQAALSTLRVGPKRQVLKTDFEFGRPASEEAERAFQELAFAQNRILYGTSLPQRTMSMPLMGSSLPYAAFSLPYSAFSLPYSAFSLPYSAFSLPYSTMSMETITPYTVPTSTPTQTPIQDHDFPCVMHDLTNASSTNITITVEVETITGTTNFLDALAHTCVSAVLSSLSLCMPSETRLLAIRSLVETKVTGVQVNDNSGVVEYATCIPLTPRAFCNVVNVGLTVFAEDNNSTMEAGQQVRKEVQDQIEDGRMKELLHSDDVVALRIAHANSAPSGNVSAAEEGKRTPRGLASAAIRNTAIAILSVALVVAVGLVVYKKIHQSESVSGDAVSASCDESSISGATGEHTDCSLNGSYHTETNSASV